MTHLQRNLIILVAAIICCGPVCAQETEQETKKEIESPSPDGQFAFRYTGDSHSETEKQTYDLIDKKSGKTLMTVAESDPDLGPSARFDMTVLWRPDSKAFALTAFLWKRGTSLFVFVRDGAKFREIELPKLEADVPEKEKKGKSYPHVAGLNSQEAKEWQKDGSLVAEIETMLDGGEGSITATRTVVLGFDKSKKAKLLKSKMEYKIEKGDE